MSTQEPKAKSFVVYKPAGVALKLAGAAVEWVPVSLAFALNADQAKQMYETGWLVRPVEDCPAEDVIRVATVACASFLMGLVMLAGAAQSEPMPALDPSKLRAQGQ
jgi:hypothetical protein